MAIDVLEYNSTAADITLLRDTCVPAANTAWYNCGLTAGTAVATQVAMGSANRQTLYPKRWACDLWSRPWETASWGCIPTLGTVTGSVAVCDQSGAIRCGSCCLWTVPAGTTFARFQIWGAGAGSHSMCCCGGGFWGGSGAYASVIIPVVPGCQYTLCAGCAACCFAQSAGASATPGCASFVSGFGLTNFCAEGGESNMYCWINRFKRIVDGVCTTHPLSFQCSIAAKGNYEGWCMCSGGGFCFSGSCSHMGAIPFVTSCKIPYGCVTNATNRCHFVVGAPGSFNCAAVDNQCSCHSYQLCHPPIVGFSSSARCVNMTPGSTCHGCCFCPAGFHAFPSRGGWPSSVAGGSSNYGGGMGAGGFVCVQFTTST